MSFLRQPDHILLTYSLCFHFLNDKAFLNLPPVGAAISRPPADRRENKNVISIVTGRAPAITILSSLHPNCPSGEERTSDARPYDEGVV